MFGFLGQYQHSFDDKNRLTIPARFRDLLAEGAFITQGFDRNLMVTTTTAFEQVYSRLNALNMADQNARLMRRLILGSAFQVEIDKSGRILIPQNLRQFATLEGEVVLVGQGDYFEVWAPKLWQEQLDKLQDTEANNQRFATLNLSAH
jgi:MraZ protein